MLTIGEHDSRRVGGEAPSGVFNIHGFKQLLLQFRLGIKPTRDKEVVREKKRNEEKLLLVYSYLNIDHKFIARQK